MAQIWVIRSGRLVADAAASEGTAEARVELLQYAKGLDAVDDPAVHEVLTQAEHATAPFAERLDSCVAGVVVLPVCMSRASGKVSDKALDKTSAAARFGFLLQPDTLMLFDDHGICDRVIERLVADGVSVETVASVLRALLCAPLREQPELLTRVRDDLEVIEERLLEGRVRVDRARMMADVRHLIGLDAFYQGMSDVLEVLSDEASDMLGSDDRKRFAAVARRLDRLSARLESLQDYNLQVHGLYQEEIDIQQNSVMQWLTVVATIFMPLTFITSWYGMNFKNIPLLGASWGYPVMVAMCVVIAVAQIVVFRRRGWLSFGGGKERRTRRRRRGKGDDAR